MSAESNITCINRNGQGNGNGTHYIRNEVDQTETQALAEEDISIQVLFDLVRKTKECDDKISRKTDIYDILEANPGICTKDIKNENVFHCLAENDEHSSEILSLFAFYGDNSDTECDPLGAKSFTKYVTEQQLKELLYMQSSLKRQLPIHVAVENGFTLFVTEILRLYPALVSQVDGNGCTPLHYAAKNCKYESLACTNVILKVMQNENATMTVFRTKTTETNETPIHAICSNVPTTKESQVVEKMKSMLLSASSSECNDGLVREVLEAHNKEGFTPLHLLCNRKETDILKNVYEDMYNRYWLMRALFEFMDTSDLMTLTKNGSESSVLHLAVNSELPILLKFFLQKIDEQMLGKKDKTGKTVFHCAAENSIRPVKQQCLKLLADWKTFGERFTTNIGDFKPNEFFCHSLLLDTAEDELNVKNTALTLACKARSIQSVKLILRNIKFSNPDFEKWCAESKLKDHYIESLKHVYWLTPDALVGLFNKSIHIDMEKSNDNMIEFKADLSVIEVLQKSHKESDGTVGTAYLESAECWPDHVQEKLLLHSITHCALEKVWKTQLRKFKILWIILHLAWFGLHTILVPLKCKQPGQKTEASVSICYQIGDNSTGTYYDFGRQEHIAAWILMIWTLIYCLSELLVMNEFPSKSYSIGDIFIEIGQTSSALIIATIACAHSLGTNTSPHNCFTDIAGAGVFLAGLKIFLNLAVVYFPFGKWIEYIIQGLIEIMKLMALASPLVAGYVYADRQIFPEAFQGWLGDWGRFLAITSGDTNYSENFHRSRTWDNGGLVAIISFIGHWAVFPMTYMSISLGIVFDKIKTMKTKLDVSGMSSHIQLTNYMQRTLVYKFERILPRIFKKYDNSKEVTWFIEWNKDHDGFRAFYCSFWKCCERELPCSDSKALLCGNGLPKTVKKGLHKLYQKKAKEQRALIMKIDHE